MRPLFTRILLAAALGLGATLPAQASTSSNTLADCQPVAPYQYANGAMTCTGTLDATGKRFQFSFTVSNGNSVSNVKYIVATRTPTVLWFKGVTGRLVQANPLVNNYTLSIRGPVTNAYGTPVADAAGNPLPFTAEQHLQLVVPAGISGPGAPLFEPLNGAGIANFIAY